MRIVIPGGAGQVGTILARHFVAGGDDVVVLSRTPRPAPWRTLPWDGRTPEEHWAREIDGAAVVINLAGRSVNCRYNAANRRDIMDSRVRSTRAVGLAIAGAADPPPVWLQASTATIYAHTFGQPNDEANGVIGGREPDAPPSWRISIDVAEAWERECLAADTPRTRRVLMRLAMVMSPDRGGIFDTIMGLVRKGLGGRNGHGRQFVSWVHERDFVRAVGWLIEHAELEGPVNIASPNPLPNAEFMRELRLAAGVPIGLPATRWMLAAGAVLLRTETELLLKSRRVVPGRLLKSGFGFDFPQWRPAADELIRRWRLKRAGKPTSEEAADA